MYFSLTSYNNPPRINRSLMGQFTPCYIRGLYLIIYKWVSQQQDEIDAYIDELVEQCVEQNGIKDNVDLAWKCAVCLLYLQKKCPAEKSLKMVG